MSKKHFESMAEYAREIKSDKERSAVIQAFVAIASQFNPKFDVDRFRAACEPK